MYMHESFFLLYFAPERVALWDLWSVQLLIQLLLFFPSLFFFSLFKWPIFLHHLQLAIDFFPIFPILNSASLLRQSYTLDLLNVCVYTCGRTLCRIVVLTLVCYRVCTSVHAYSENYLWLIVVGRTRLCVLSVALANDFAHASADTHRLSLHPIRILSVL